MDEPLLELEEESEEESEEEESEESEEEEEEEDEKLVKEPDEDPGEQNNRIDDPECQDSRSRLDAELTTRIIESINAAHIEKAHQTSWEDPVFCQGEGRWERDYPNPIA